jgi:hypothetical protein
MELLALPVGVNGCQRGFPSYAARVRFPPPPPPRVTTVGERVAGATRGLINPESPWREIGSIPTLSAQFHCTLIKWSYNSLVAESLKVDADKFKAAIRALLNTPPKPMAEIAPKRAPKAGAKKRSAQQD